MKFPVAKNACNPQLILILRKFNINLSAELTGPIPRRGYRYQVYHHLYSMRWLQNKNFQTKSSAWPGKNQVLDSFNS